jgi:hypothetical protein
MASAQNGLGAGVRFHSSLIVWRLREFLGFVGKDRAIIIICEFPNILNEIRAWALYSLSVILGSLWHHVKTQGYDQLDIPDESLGFWLCLMLG